jgi:hypothetical protein
MDDFPLGNSCWKADFAFLHPAGRACLRGMSSVTLSAGLDRLRASDLAAGEPSSWCKLRVNFGGKPRVLGQGQSFFFAASSPLFHRCLP